MRYFLISYLTWHKMTNGREMTLGSTYWLTVEILERIQFLKDCRIILNITKIRNGRVDSRNSAYGGAPLVPQHSRSQALVKEEGCVRRGEPM